MTYMVKTKNMKIDRIKPLTAKIGIYGVGHYNYWPQFEGLYEKMEEKIDTRFATGLVREGM